MYKYSIGDTVNVRLPHPAGRWEFPGATIDYTGKIIGVENYVINAIPVYRVKLEDGKYAEAGETKVVNEGEILGRAGHR